MVESDRRSTLLHSYENAAVIVSGITVDQVDHRTTCPGYDVAGLIDHIVEAAFRAAALGRGQARLAGADSPHVEPSDAPRLPGCDFALYKDPSGVQDQGSTATSMGPASATSPA